MPSLKAAFIQARAGLFKELITDCKVGNNLDTDVENPKTRSYKALWDTGATDSGITKKVARECGLIATDKTIVYTPSGEYYPDVYLVDIYLPSNVLISQVHASEIEPQKSLENESLDVLIGMDIISQGDFAVSNFQNRTMFAFRYPSMAHIDGPSFFLEHSDEGEG